MYFGTDYYPEHWPEERWLIDAKLMKEAGFNVVRLAEFAWHKMESREGAFDFSWLDRAIEVLSKEGIAVVLGTPTEAPPKWLMDKHPEIYQIEADGRVKGFGTRRHYCTTTPIYHDYTKKIVHAMGQHYQNNPNVIAWQIDNEFGCHGHICYCDDCLSGFKVWVKDKYQTIDALNEAWGTIFWSQTYNDFNEVIIPRFAQCDSGGMSGLVTHNPGLLLDYHRFQSDSVVAYQGLQIDILKTYTDMPITHNFMGHASDLDYFDLAKDLDFISWDNYVDMQWGRSSYEKTSMAHEITYGSKEQNFWVMEQQSGPCGWNIMGKTPVPGEIRLWTHQAIAHGADGIVYFRWRPCTVGIEQYWHGVLDHDGMPRRRYNEIKAIGKEVASLDNYVKTQPTSEIAIIKSYENLWSHNFQPHTKGFDYNELLIAYNTAFMHQYGNISVASIETDLSQFKLVLLPAFNLMSDAYKLKLEAYVESGGHILLTFRSGTKNMENGLTTETLPGYFRNLAGIELKEYDPLGQSDKVRIDGSFGKGTATLWCDIIDSQQAKVIGTYKDNFYAGEAAITCNQYGTGSVYYVGCDLDEQGLENLAAYVLKDIEVQPPLGLLPSGIELIQKSDGTLQTITLLNHNNLATMVQLPCQLKDYQTGVIVSDTLTLEPLECRILTHN